VTPCVVYVHIYHTAYNHVTQYHAEKNIILMEYSNVISSVKIIRTVCPV